jgi:phage replication-related protein YjqB (UPF0714/DUF867 family)
MAAFQAFLGWTLTNYKAEVADPMDTYGGYFPLNIVNVLAPGGGIQIEQTTVARKDYGQQIAEAIVDALFP